MTARELRIGNYIDRNGLMEVRVISQSGVKIYDHVNNIFPPTFFDFDENIKPIPLTEEWLLKFGFELLTDKKKGYKNTSYSHGIIPILLYWDGSRLSTTFWQGNEMRFVHQLQNLIFALTGNELTINNNQL